MSLHRDGAGARCGRLPPHEGRPWVHKHDLPGSASWQCPSPPSVARQGPDTSPGVPRGTPGLDHVSRRRPSRPRGEEISMQDWQDGQVRYLVHFDDGGSGMRHRSEPLEPGAELHDGGARYRWTGAPRRLLPPRPSARLRHPARSRSRAVRHLHGRAGSRRGEARRGSPSLLARGVDRLDTLGG